MDDLRAFRDRVAEDIQRWLDELRAPARATLEVGIGKRACDFAEKLLRSVGEDSVGAAGEAGREALATVSNGKPVAKLTLGQWVELLVLMDSKRLLVAGRKVISKADKALLERVSASRNAFVHRPIAVEDVKTLLLDIQRLIALPVVRVGRDPG